MSPRRLGKRPSPKASSTLSRLAIAFGREVFDERTRKRWRLGDLAHGAGMSTSEVHRIEAGRAASLEACVRVGVALGLTPALTLRQSRIASVRDSDPVHAAMGEVQASHLRDLGYQVRMDEPYQHYQFAGRADLIAVNVDDRALLHIENRTRFPDIQAFAGSWNAKRAYLAVELASRLGVRGGWLSVDHVVVALWSSEILHSLRLREASFRSVCPDDADGFRSWWTGEAPHPGERSTLVLFDPLPGERRSRRRWVGLDSLHVVDPRYRGYADALDRLRAVRLA